MAKLIMVVLLLFIGYGVEAETAAETEERIKNLRVVPLSGEGKPDWVIGQRTPVKGESEKDSAFRIVTYLTFMESFNKGDMPLSHLLYHYNEKTDVEISQFLEGTSGLNSRIEQEIKPRIADMLCSKRRVASLEEFYEIDAAMSLKRDKNIIKAFAKFMRAYGSEFQNQVSQHIDQISDGYVTTEIDGVGWARDAGVSLEDLYQANCS